MATEEDAWQRTRAAVIRNGLGIAIASGAYALSFGAISVTAGLSILQTCALSLLMFTGASQFALVGVIGSGGSSVAAGAAAVLLGTRNALYGLRLASLLRVRGARKLPAAHLVLDETTAMAVLPEAERAGRLGFWTTGIALLTFWNLGTLIGALGAHAIADPRVLGLDAAPSAAFLALLAPRMRSRQLWVVALSASAVALISVPAVPAGVPVLLAAVVATVWGLAGPAGQASPAKEQSR